MGACQGGLESTIIDARGATPIILRPGAITAEMVADATNITPKIISGSISTETDIIAPDIISPNIISPGQLARHYAPRAKLRLNATAPRAGEAWLGFGTAPDSEHNLSPQGDLLEAASNLFAMLRDLDASGAGNPLPSPRFLLRASALPSMTASPARRMRMMPMPLNSAKIITALGSLVGDKHLATADADKEKYLTDWRGVYRGEAIAVVKPATTDEVSRILKLAEAENIAIIPQGGNTGLCGGATPDTGARNVILSTENLNQIREIDRESQTITAEAGCVLDSIKAAAEEHGLFFPLNLGARGSCQIGGNLATNAGGLNVVRYGNARALTLGIEAVLMGGATLPLLSKLKKDNMGYDLKHFFIGAEGTLGVITAATLQLFPKPQNLATAFVGLRDIDAGIALLQHCQRASNQSVSAFELMPKTIIDAVAEFYPDTPKFIKELPTFFRAH